MTPLSGKQRRHLRALAHDHKAIVQIGHAGLTPEVLAAIDQALEIHELIKVKVASESPESAAAYAPALESGTHSSVAQVIGRTLIVYRERKKDPKIVLPQSAAPGARKRK